jgi:hypothetical protein
MDLAEKKVEIIEWVAALQDKSALKKLEQLKKQSIKEAYEARLKPFTKAELKARAKQANKAIKAGKVTSIEDLEKESAKW